MGPVCPLSTPTSVTLTWNFQLSPTAEGSNKLSATPPKCALFPKFFAKTISVTLKGHLKGHRKGRRKGRRESHRGSTPGWRGLSTLQVRGPKSSCKNSLADEILWSSDTRRRWQTAARAHERSGPCHIRFSTLRCGEHPCPNYHKKPSCERAR